MLAIYSTLNEETPLIVTRNPLTLLRARRLIRERLREFSSLKFKITYRTRLSKEIVSKLRIDNIEELHTKMVHIVVQQSGLLYREIISVAIYDGNTCLNINRVNNNIISVTVPFTELSNLQLC